MIRLIDCEAKFFRSCSFRLIIWFLFATRLVVKLLDFVLAIRVLELIFNLGFCSVPLISMFPLFLLFYLELPLGLILRLLGSLDILTSFLWTTFSYRSLRFCLDLKGSFSPS